MHSTRTLEYNHGLNKQEALWSVSGLTFIVSCLRMGELCICYKRGFKDNKDIIVLCRFGYAWENFGDKWLSHHDVHLFKDSDGKLHKWTDFNEDTGETVTHEGINIYRFYNIALEQVDYEDSLCGINVYDSCDYWISLDNLTKYIKQP